MINRLTRFVILIAALTVAVLGGVALPAAAETGEAADEATVSGPNQVAVGEGITISGTGWVAPSGGGSVIAVKLDDGDIQRTTPIADPVTQNQLAGNIFAVVRVGSDGSFTTTVEFPTTANATKTWAAGSKGSVRLLTGKLLDGDQTRSVEVSFEVVSGTETAPSPTKSAETSPTLEPTKSAETSPESDAEKPAEIRMLPQVNPTAPRVTAAATCSDDTTAKLTGESTSGGKPAAPLGGNLRLVGTGYCVQDGTSGSVIAIKIDDGNIDPVSPKGPRGVWQLINVGNDGSFDVVVKVPTASQTKPALTAGAHSLRLLTGSSKDGDVQRTLKLDFVVTGSSSNSSPSSTTSTNSTATSSNTSNNSSSTNSTSGKLAATGGSRPVVLVIGLILIVAGIAVLRPDGAHSDVGRNDS
ncbi:hypothetical protein MLP_27410 [Microlunatus phosphovorus NM-1]|uniref:Uncharacterized protein n=1 Tax=Microlunatus phosphovorus (strain ATCC 700054 / DSM 10555 / JCM 9379 / NBRC 101784 / NCIMB 13414 / VKM Ac-1990 / NM-1) TaxID=1032480 RepID=F5XI86_MICPN|nr:hypothetical protein [Microlunatus phosphovorus]BAK35755.1 hypothetical protein MLP_27410 [Microlunatus phosphovorus NM-1]